MISGTTEPASARTSDSARTDGRARPMAADERRKMIVDTVIPLVLEHGVEVTTRQIAESAGIAEGTVFRVFEDKNEVIDAAIERVLDPTDVLAALNRIDRNLPLDVTVEMIVTFLQARVRTMIAFMSALGPRDHARHFKHGQHAQPPLGEATDIIEALLEPHRVRIRVPLPTAVDYIRVLVFGTSMPYLRGPKGDPSELTDFILRGIAAEKE